VYDLVAGDHFLKDPRFSLTMRPWCKLAHAGIERMDCHVKLELRGIPAQAWHLATAEHILGNSCWIERLHPSTRSRSDLSMFRLDGRARDPKEIKAAVVLVIVEQLPVNNPTAKPSTCTLTFPIAIKLISAILDDDALGDANPTPDRVGDGDRRDDPGGGARRQRPRRHDRKRRRSTDAPHDGADGMAMDCTGWRQGRGGYADGVACDPRWAPLNGATLLPSPAGTNLIKP